jgi:hypothetical protein
MLDPVGLAPGPDGGVFMRGEVVQDQKLLLVGPASTQGFEEVQELARAFPIPDPIVDFPGGQVEAGDHVPDTVVTVVGGPQPDRLTLRLPGFPGPWLQVQRAELVDANDPTAGGWMVVEVQDPAHGFDADRGDAAGLDQVLTQLGQ